MEKENLTVEVNEEVVEETVLSGWDAAIAEEIDFRVRNKSDEEGVDLTDEQIAMYVKKITPIISNKLDSIIDWDLFDDYIDDNLGDEFE